VRKTKKVLVGGIVGLLATATLAACGDAPEEESGGSGTETEALDFTPCIVSDAGGFDDKSFNQLGFEGATQAADELGVDLIDVESNSENDYGPNLEALVSQGCDAIVTVGFALSAATVESAKANPDIEYVLIDDAADNDFDGTKDADNVKPLLYNTAEADYYAQEKGKDIKVVGWNGKTGSFTGGFEANEAATSTARRILDQDADVILPVGGPIYQGALTAIADSGKDVALIGTDADVFETDPNTQDVIMTSILKGMKVSTYEAIMAAGEDTFDFESYIGTLENDGVGIAPFHNYESKVSDTITAELEEVKAGIIDGSIPVTSYLAP